MRAGIHVCKARRVDRPSGFKAMAAVQELRSRTISSNSEITMEKVGLEKVAQERARLREQARRGNRALPNPVGEGVNRLLTARRSHIDEVNTLWPNLLRDSDMLSFYVPDTEPIQDSQVPHDIETVGAQLEEGAPVDPLDTFISEGDSTGSSDDLEDPHPTPAINSTLPNVAELSSSGEDDEGMEISQPATNDSTQGNRVGRQLVHKDHVTVLVKSYQKAFKDFKRTKKGVAPSQLIPSKVWKQVYNEYKKQFPQSKFKEDSLKDHLRQSVRDMAKTQTELEESEDNPTHDEELMERLMATDSWKARNVLQSRMDAMRQMSGLEKETVHAGKGTSAPASEASGQAGSGPATSEVKKQGPATSEVGKQKVSLICKPPTKSQNLKDARQDMSAMLGEFKSMAEERRADTSRKRMLAESKASLQEAKRQESEARRATLTQQRTALEEQAKMGRLNLLKEQKALGLISDLEFQAKCRELFGL